MTDESEVGLEIFFLSLLHRGSVRSHVENDVTKQTRGIYVARLSLYSLFTNTLFITKIVSVVSLRKLFRIV